MNNSTLHSISYRSRAVIEVNARFWQHLGAVAHERNARMGITGGLIFDGTHFFQTIEGGRDDVLNLMKLIQSDPAHTDIIPFGIRPIAARFFDGWALKIVPPETKTTSTFAQFGNLNLRDPDTLLALNSAIRAA